MAKYQKKTNYWEKYPGISNEIIEVLEKSDCKMEYQQYDIKVERCKIDYASGTVTFLSSREDSYDRLLEENRQFAADGEGVDDVAIKAVMSGSDIDGRAKTTCGWVTDIRRTDSIECDERQGLVI